MAIASLQVQGQAQNIYHVRSGATGSNDGSDWNNAYTALPATLKRGATYFIADGSYGSYSFDDAASGTSLITIKKAIATDHGANAGWSGTYGDGVASFSYWDFIADYYALDGQIGGGPNNWDSGFGFKVASSVGRRVVFQPNVNHITIQHVEITNSNNTPDNGSSFGGLVYAYSNVTDIRFSHCKIHHVYGPCFHTGYPGAERWTVEYTKTGDNTGDGFHSEIWSLRGMDNLTIRYCWLYAWRSTGGIIAINGTEGAFGDGEICEDWAIYGNVFKQDGTTANWLIAAINDSSNQQFARRWKIFNNTFVDINSSSVGVNAVSLATTGESNNEVKNNVWYGNTDTMSLSVSDYNSYQGSGASFTGPNDQLLTSNPFINYAAGDLRLSSGSILRAGLALGEPYNQDMFGNIRGADGVWDRGAYEFGTGVPDTKAPVISNPSASSVTSSSAVIIWTTDEPGSSVVNYGTTTNFGATSTDLSAVLSHNVVLANLTPDTLYHYRVRSVDAAGNTATSPNFSFQTGVPDAVPPTVNLSTPASGAVVSGSLTLNASASDNAGGSGVASVTFLVNGNLAGNDESPPYSVTWDSRLVLNGSHQVQARATDGDGNQATSAPVTINVQNAQPNLSSELVGYWSFDEMAGFEVRDSSGNGYDSSLLTDSNWIEGKFKGALNFTLADDQDRVDQGALNVSGDQLTLAAWIQVASVGTDPRVIAKATGTQNEDIYWMLEIDDDSAASHEFGFRIHSGGSLVRLTGGSVPIGQWVHLAGVYDGSTMRLYRNGVQVASTAKTGDLRTGAASVWVGDNPSTGSRPFAGRIDEVRIYSRTLSPIEIQALCSATPPNPPSAPRLVVN